MEYPDPDSQEEEEVEDEIDTSKIQEAMEKTKEEENQWPFIMRLIRRNLNDEGMEDFQKMLMGIFSQFMGGDAQAGQPNPDMESFMREFQAGFASGAAASNQYAQTTAQSENASINPLLRFLFTASSGLSWTIASGNRFLFTRSVLPPLRIRWVEGHLRFAPDAVCGASRLLVPLRQSGASRFAFQYPYFLLSSSFTPCVPGILGWLLTLLNVVTGSTIGDWLGTIVDSVFFALKVFTRFRFHMVSMMMFLDGSSSVAGSSATFRK